MGTDIASKEPETFRAGDTVKWKRSLDCYKASEPALSLLFPSTLTALNERLQLRLQPVDRVGVGGIVDLVFQFGVVFPVVVKFLGQDFAGAKVNPLGQPIAVIANAVAHRLRIGFLEVIRHRPRELRQCKILRRSKPVEMAGKTGAFQLARLF